MAIDWWLGWAWAVLVDASGRLKLKSLNLTHYSERTTAIAVGECGWMAWVGQRTNFASQPTNQLDLERHDTTTTTQHPRDVNGKLVSMKYYYGCCCCLFFAKRTIQSASASLVRPDRNRDMVSWLDAECWPRRVENRNLERHKILHYLSTIYLVAGAAAAAVVLVIIIRRRELD